jgi:recombination protein RecA
MAVEDDYEPWQSEGAGMGRSTDDLEATLARIEKQFGQGAVMRLGENAHMSVEVVPTGVKTLDVALGVGGLPRGRIVELFGPESSGKSTLALHVVAEAQRSGGVCVYIDAEHAIDPVYAKAVGVDVDKLLISQPDSGEQALEIADMLVRSGSVAVVVIDSVAALTPRAEIEGEMGDAHVGLQARLMSQALRKLTSPLARSNSIAIFVNQLREKVGVPYGLSETTPGGRALKFFASVRLDIRRVETIKEAGEVVGQRTRVKVVKNKCGGPHKVAEFDILYGSGINLEGALIDAGLMLGEVTKAGSWYSYHSEQLGQGREAAKRFLVENPAVRAQLEHSIAMKLGGSARTDVLVDHSG